MNMFAKKEEAAVPDGQESMAEVLDKEIAIYTMPEKFRFVTVKATSDKKTGLVIVIFGGLFVLALAIATYFLLFNDKKSVSKPALDKVAEKPETDNIPAEPEQPAPKIIESPREAYLRLKREMVLSPGEAVTTPTADQIGEIAEEVNGNYATLKAETKDASMSGVIGMAEDASGWRISNENWITLESKSATTTPETIVIYKAGVDMDGDWLTDKEEALLGSNPGLPDSDGDTYPDISEFSNSYNPAGPGKLADNSNIARYDNKTFGYSLLYPSAWTLSASSDEAVIMRAGDDQFFQVISQPNADRETIEAWYARQFAQEEIPAGRVVEAETWKGVKSEDDLIIYLTDKESSYIFTLVYNPAGDVLEYPNLFKLAAKTLELK